MTKVRPAICLSTSALALAAASMPGAASAVPPLALGVGTFSLPPGPNSTPEVEGPVTEGVAPPRDVATPTPTPTPTAVQTPQPTPVPAATPAPAPSATATPAQDRFPIATPSPTPRPSPTIVSPLPTASPTQAEALGELDSAVDVADESAEPTIEEVSETGTPAADIQVTPGRGLITFDWTILLIALFAILSAIGAVLLWRNRRRSPGEPLIVPLIERPKVPPKPEPQPDLQPDELPAAARPAPTPATLADQQDNPLKITLEARQVAISLTAATLSYRITVSNLGKTLLRDLSISGDMISAHSSMTQDEQIATPDLELKDIHEIDRLPGGESVQFTGEFRLPFTSIRPIRTGNTSLFVPLARLRAKASNSSDGAVVLTALVGQRNPRPQMAIQPFRLDLGPRIYQEVTQRIFS